MNIKVEQVTRNIKVNVTTQNVVVRRQYSNVQVNQVGRRGVKGDAGESATVEVGTVTTGEPGTPVIVTNSGTDNNAILNFTIPEGEKGDGSTPEWGGITGSLTDQTDLQDALDNKVDKVSGKGLSTEDYTTAEKTKLTGIATGAEVNVNADWNASSGDAQILNKPTIPTLPANIVQSVTAGTNVTVDNSDPENPIISASGGGGGGAVDSVNGQTGTVVLDADDIDDSSTTQKFATATQLSNADNAVQPGDLATVATSGDYNDLTNKPTIPNELTDLDTTVTGTQLNSLKTKVDGIESGAEVNNISDANATDLTDAGDTTLHYHASDRSRANHTGTQTLSTISDVTATATEVNVLDGITSTTTELNYTDGVTSNIQTQLNSKTSNTGTVTSVGVTVPTGLSISGSPITTSGTAAITYTAGYQGYTTTEATKLSGIATAATANSSDATLLARANHTGTQTASTISDFSTAADARITAATATGSGSLVRATSPTIVTPTIASFTNATHNHSNAGGGGTIAYSALTGTPTLPSGAIVGTTDSQTLTNKDLTSGTNTFPTFNQNTTGSAATLTTGRTFRTNLASTTAVSFDGSADITPGVTGTLPAGNGGTGNAFTAFTGPTTSTKTFTLPNATATILTSNAAVTVAQGGTGRATATTAYGLIAAGTTATGAQQTISPGTSGHFLKSGGASALASFSAIVATDIAATGTPSSSTYLRGDNTWATISGGSGDVVGPSSSYSRGVAVFNDGTGKLLASSDVSIDSSGNMIVLADATVAGHLATGTPGTAGSSVVTNAATQTLTNKTLTSPVINNPTGFATGWAKLTVGTTAPSSPSTGDLWVDSN